MGRVYQPVKATDDDLRQKMIHFSWLRHTSHLILCGVSKESVEFLKVGVVAIQKVGPVPWFGDFHSI